MSKDKNIPLCYQLTVSNVTKIGDKVMSDFYVIFKSTQKNQNSWQSPIIHGRLSKENSGFPWNFIIDNPKLTVDFCEVDDKTKKGVVTGSTPLLLMKKEGEEQFLIFGCKQQNRGRKVAQVQFSYVQCSLAKSSFSDGPKKETKMAISQSDSNKRVQLQFSSQHDANSARPSQLNVIHQQQEMIKQTLNQSQIEEQKYLVINPSRMDTLQFSYKHNKSVSQNDLQVLRQMEDATDKWYRSNFGKDKPMNLENIQFQNQNAFIPVNYQQQYRHLHNPSSVGTYIQLKNLLVNLDKRPKAIDIFSISLQNEQIKKKKIASIQCSQGHHKDWKTLVRLPVEAKGYELEIITDKNEKFYSMIGNDGNYDRHKVDVYNDDGQAKGTILFNMKPIKTMQIQTLEMVSQNPSKKGQQDKTVNDELNLSFIKSTSHYILKDKSSKLQKQSYLVPKLDQKTNPAAEKLQNNAYIQRQKNKFAQLLNKQKFNSQPFTPQSQKGIKRSQRNLIQSPVAMTNQAYIGKHLYSTKGRFRRNQYELADDHQSVEVSQLVESKKFQTFSEQNNKTKLHEDVNKHESPSQKHLLEKVSSKEKNGKKKPVKSAQPIKQYLQRETSIIDDFPSKDSSKKLQKEDKQTYNKQQIEKKIQEIRKLSNQLQKIAKNSSPLIFKKQKNQGDPYKSISRLNDFYQARKVEFPSDQEEEKVKVARKKTYREPINVTPFFTSLSNQNFIKIQQNHKNRQPIQDQLPLKNRSNNNKLKHHYSPTSIERERRRVLSKDQKQLIYSQSQRPQKGRNDKNAKQTQQGEQRQLGVNTDRMALVKNILQTSYKPQVSIQKNSQNKDKLKINNNQHQRLYRQQTGSSFDSVYNQNLNHHTKYSSQTIQPITNQPLIDFILTTISVHTYQNIFGAKFLRVFVPNKFHYQTQRLSSNNLTWECKGMVFNRISPQESLYIEIVSQLLDKNQKLGKAKIGGVEFKHVKKQGLIRAYLVYQSEVVGQAVLTFRNAAKNSELNLNQFQRPRRNNTTNQYESIQMLEKETQKIKTYKKSKSPKTGKNKSKKRSDSLTDITKSKRKQKVSRFIHNEGSRAHLQSRKNPIRQKKYEGGKNIIIGRNTRFALSEEQQYHKIVPGPGAYEPKQ